MLGEQGLPGCCPPLNREPDMVRNSRMKSIGDNLPIHHQTIAEL